MTAPQQKAPEQGEQKTVLARLLDGKGGATSLDWPQIRTWQIDQGVLWVHLDRTTSSAQDWINNESGLDEVVCEAMLADETRPRLTMFGENVLVNLRGVNINTDLSPEELISIRIFCQRGRIITTSKFPLMSVGDLQTALDSNIEGPTSEGELLVFIAERMVDRLIPIIFSIREVIDDFEEIFEDTEQPDPLENFAETRRKISAFQRYIVPQSLIFKEFNNLHIPWLKEQEKIKLREIADSTQLLVDTLNEARERMWILRDEVQNRLDRQMNRTIYVLTILSTLLLPLSVITGLLGINVGGIPGADHPWAFPIVTAGILVFFSLEILLLRLLKWF
ncbi:MAG: hypothetical protein OEZ59_07405 [Deltaproteobacteria bacterium]|nr:hypothetical protein [Deltaproteobacteria bacterium]